MAVVENSAAIGASDQLLLGLATDENLSRQPHMATAANAVLHANHHGFTFVADQPLITAPGSFVDGRGKLFAVGGKFRELFF
jgi:hypothetical protein